MRSWPGLLLLVACGGGADWGEIEVVDETSAGESGWLVELALREVYWMSDVSGLDRLGVKTIAFVDSIDLPDGELQNTDPDSAGYAAAGRYIGWKKRIEVSLDHPVPPLGVRHELCHAIDRSRKLSKEHESTLTVDFLPERLQRTAEFLPGHEAAEVLAILCEQPSPDRYAAAVAQACELQLQDEPTALVQSWAYPELVPPMAAAVDMGVDRWVDLPLEEGQEVNGSTLVSGRLWALVRTSDGTEEQVLAIDPGTGEVVERLPIPSSAARGYRRMIVSDDLLLVYVQGKADALSWVDGQWQPVTLPDPPWLPGNPHAGRVFFQRWDPAAVLVWDPSDSSWTEEALPDGARPASFDLRNHGDRLLLSSEPLSWERVGAGWESIDGPHAYGADNWVLLDDDRTVSAWRIGWTAGMSLSRSDGTYSLAAGACDDGTEVEYELASDGQRVVAKKGQRIGLVRLP